MRLDRTLGNSSAFFANLMIGKKTVKASDFSPYDSEPEQVAGVDEVFSLLSAIAKKD